MHTLVALLASWGYVILAAFVVAEQVPLPVPAVPVLLGIGALAADGRMSIVAALVIACAASVPMDLLWRRLGAVRGTRALGHMTRLSLEPASRVRRIQTFFERYGSRVLLIAKFVPGLTVLAPALAGLVKVPLTQFLILDIAGVLLWAGTWMSLGYLFGRAPELIIAQTTRAGNLLAGLATAFMVYVLLKTVRRQRAARSPGRAWIGSAATSVPLAASIRHVDRQGCAAASLHLCRPRRPDPARQPGPDPAHAD